MMMEVGVAEEENEVWSQFLEGGGGGVDVDDEESSQPLSESYVMGFVITNIVGLRYYTGRINGREMVLVREPLNPFDPNAIKVLKSCAGLRARKLGESLHGYELGWQQQQLKELLSGSSSSKQLLESYYYSQQLKEPDVAAVAGSSAATATDSSSLSCCCSQQLLKELLLQPASSKSCCCCSYRHSLSCAGWQTTAL
ncbi:uncharacterized protein A4U43_C07F31850 [Asparagus officinalis]|uniref:HIRAN domain-containing protein n=1 Tax=Asparagus officinalis TaxID=4686 RepID=A0A5P1EID9_ASPOF|nr:uncharacterized protein A4U43_C07F31850 [Asparagus officinalis]